MKNVLIVVLIAVVAGLAGVYVGESEPRSAYSECSCVALPFRTL